MWDVSLQTTRLLWWKNKIQTHQSYFTQFSGLVILISFFFFIFLKIWIRSRAFTKTGFVRNENSKIVSFVICTVGQSSHEYRLKYWATRSSVRTFAHTADLFACSALLASLARYAVLTCSLTSLTPSLVEKCMIGWLSYLCFFFYSDP